jgi:NAD(P)-dependent dehydrogenase (short-subunit alcohol dehydrogenase family)
MGSERVVLITGTSSEKGIGYATARRLAAGGHTVYATVRDPATAADVAAGARPGRIEVRTLDLLDRAAMGPLLDRVIADEGRLDTVVNNAGYGLIGGIEEVDLEDAERSFRTNVWGTMALVQEVLPRMRERGSGHLIAVSSCFVAGLPVMGMGYYLASKAALETIFQSLAVEEAPNGIRATCFQPGPVMTELEREWGERTPPGGDPRPTISDELYAWVGAGGPAPQGPDEVADAIAALVEADDPPLAAQSSDASRAYAAAALRDPSRGSELAELLSAIEGLRSHDAGAEQTD